MKWIPVKISTINVPTYIDIDKAYKISILRVDGKYRVRAFFQILIKGLKDAKEHLIYSDIVEKDSQEQATAFLEELLGDWLEKK